jgi:hypothetical protein
METLSGIDSEVEKLALLEELWKVAPSIWNRHGVSSKLRW